MPLSDFKIFIPVSFLENQREKEMLEVSLEIKPRIQKLKKDLEASRGYL